MLRLAYSMLLPAGSPRVDLALSGPEPDQLKEFAEDLVRRLARGEKLTGLRAGPQATATRSVTVAADPTAAGAGA